MRIVAGYIPTPEGLAAVDHAVSRAAVDGSHVVVVSTGHEGNHSHEMFAPSTDLDALDARIAEAGISHEIRQSTSGRSAAVEILSTATEIGADLIVIGLRRRSPVGKLIMGGTSQQVLLEAGCPVLAVKGEARSASH